MGLEKARLRRGWLDVGVGRIKAGSWVATVVDGGESAPDVKGGRPGAAAGAWEAFGTGADGSGFGGAAAVSGAVFSSWTAAPRLSAVQDAYGSGDGALPAAEGDGDRESVVGGDTRSAGR